MKKYTYFTKYAGIQTFDKIHEKAYKKVKIVHKFSKNYRNIHEKAYIKLKYFITWNKKPKKQ